MLFSGTSDLLSQIVKPLFNSSNDFSPLVNSFQRPSFLCTSSWLSSTLFWSLSSPLNSFQLVLAHLTSVPPVQFFLSPVEVTQLQTFLFRPNCLSIRSWFQHSIVLSFSCHVLSCQSYWAVDCYLWVQRSSTLGPQHFFHAREELWCHEQPFVKSAREQHSRTRLWVLHAWKAKRTRILRKQHSCACHRNAARRGKRQAAQPCALLPCFFLLDIMSPSQSSLRKVTFPQNTIVYYSRSRSSEEPRRSHHSTAICRDWVAKHKRITNNGYTNWSSKTGSRSPRTKTTILTLKHFLNLFERNFQRKNHQR